MAETPTTATPTPSAPPAAALSKGIRKKGTRKRRPSSIAALFRALGTYFDQFPEVMRGLIAEDAPTRRMAFLHFASLVGLVAAAVVTTGRAYHAWKRHHAVTQSEQAAQHIGEFLKKQADEARQRYSTFTIGTFNFELKPIPGAHLAAGVMNVGEMEIVIVCDSKETRTFIEQHLVQVRSQIIDVLVPQDRDELLTREGKRRLRKAIIDKVNAWLPHGRVDELYFSRFLIG